MSMRTTTALAASLLSLSLLAAGCGDDSVDTGAPDTTTGAGSGIDEAPDGTGVEMPDRAADLVGTITTVTPFVPVTEDCTPAEDVDPDGSVSSDDPPICTPEDNDVIGTILVEEDPDSPDSGRKISYTVTTATKITGVGVFADFAEGQTADTWVTGGACAESYPEQCGLEAIRVTS
jgi:hypothetical protein